MNVLEPARGESRQDPGRDGSPGEIVGSARVRQHEVAVHDRHEFHDRRALDLRIDRFDTLAATDALTSEWERLAGQLAPRVPFTTPLWNALWWKWFQRDGWLVSDQLRGYTVRDGAGDLVAVAPMMITTRPSFGPLKTIELQFLGADANLTELRGVVCQPDDETVVLRALQEHLARHDNDWDWVQWCGIRHRSPQPRPLADRPAQLIWQREVPLYHLDLEPSWDALRARLPRNIKESLRKCYNSLKRDGHAFKLVVRARPDESEAAITRFLALHADRSQFTATVFHHDAFGTEPARGFLYDYAGQMAQRDALRVFQLEIAGNVVATRIGFVLGDTLYLYYSGYDVQWRQYSVMTTLVCEAIKWAIDHRFAVVNLSTGNDVSKTRWRPKETMFHEAMLTAPNLRAKLAFRLTSALRRRPVEQPKALPEPEPATATFSLETTRIEPAPTRSNGAPRTLA